MITYPEPYIVSVWELQRRLNSKWETLTSKKEDAAVMTEGKANPRFYIGIVLMVGSFSTYLVYPLIPFLSYSNKIKVILAFLVWGVAWSVFAVGFAFSGKKGYQKIKNFAKELLKTRRTK